MSDHPNVTTVKRMTPAIFNQDRDALSSIFTEDLSFHMRGPEGWSGDYAGVDGFLGALGRIFEATGGDIRLEQQFRVGVTAGHRSGSTPRWAGTARHSSRRTPSSTASKGTVWPSCGCSSGPTRRQAGAFFA